MKSQIPDKEYRWLAALIIFLAIPAYLINLSELTFIDDESMRALVALEMKLSGDYITPTLAGEYYYKKPPVYNWMVAGFLSFTGDKPEMATRLPMILSLFAYAISIFLTVKKKYGKRIALVSAILFLVYLRILLYESIYGLIDITYSWFVFLSYIVIYNQYQKQRWLVMFSISYFLTGLTFLMKGLPSIAFQGIALLVIFTMNKQFKKFFMWQHFVGALPFFLLTGGYYYAYYIKNPGQISILFQTIFSESADKSAIAYGIGDIIKNIFRYFTEVMYNFIPGTLIVIFFIKKKPFELFKEDAFLRYIALVFIFCFSIFLVSPISYMRYVLPVVSLLIVMFTVHYYHFKALPNVMHVRIIDSFILVVACVLCLGQLVFPLIEPLGFVKYKWIKSIILFVILLGSILWLWNKKHYRLELLVITFLVLKLGFDLFIIPSRTHNHWQASMRENSIKIGKQLQGSKTILMNKGTAVTTTHCYMTTGKQEIIPKTQDTTGVDYVVYYSGNWHNEGKKLIHEDKIKYYNTIRIVKWNNEE